MMTDKTFDPNKAAANVDHIFGLPYEFDDSKLVLIPITWDVTTSYRAGTHRGPFAIRDASLQMDLFDLRLGDFYRNGIYMLDLNKSDVTELMSLNEVGRIQAEKIIAVGGELDGDQRLIEVLADVNKYSQMLNQWVAKQTKSIVDAGKFVGIIGGDHSVPFGAMKVMNEKYDSFGILHFDAHHDLRKAYEGFEHSHASIMYNAIQSFPSLKHLVQIGIRDFCEDEWAFARNNKERISVMYDQDYSALRESPEKKNIKLKQLIDRLPKQVWVSFDIDGLDPKLCPNTGTPVPGGLEFHEAVRIITMLVESGRKIIGFDLVEVSPPQTDETSEWDANVGMRLLYQMCGHLFESQGLAKRLD